MIDIGAFWTTYIYTYSGDAPMIRVNSFFLDGKQILLTSQHIDYIQVRIDFRFRDVCVFIETKKK